MSWKRDIWKRHGWRDSAVKKEGMKRKERKEKQSGVPRDAETDVDVRAGGRVGG